MTSDQDQDLAPLPALLASAFEPRTRQVLDAVPNVLYIFDLAEKRAVYQNRSAGLALGYSAAEIERLGNAMHELMHPEDWPRFAAHLQEMRAARDREVHAFEYRLRAHDGSWRWYRSNDAVFARAADGAVIQLIGIAEDIADRIAIEREREAALARLRLILDSMPVGCITTDNEFRISLWNPAAERIFGFRAEEVLGRLPIGTLVAAEHGAALLADLRSVAASGRPDRIARPNLTRDGRQIVCEWRNQPLYDEQGRFLGVLGMCENVTERLRLTEERDRLSSIIENAIDFVGMADPAGRVLYINRAGRAMCGIGAAEDIGRMHIQELHPAWIYDGVLRDALQTSAGDTGGWRGELELQHRDGHSIPVSVVLLAHRGATGELQYYSAVMRDISQSKRTEEAGRRLNLQLEERVRQRTAELEAAYRDLEAFTSSASHDLRTPLRAISGFSEILLEEHGAALDATGAEYLRRIVASASRMSLLIDDLLRLARVTRAPLHTAEVDLSALARDLAAELGQEPAYRQVHFDIAPGLRATGDRELLRIALHNLLDNACKFSRHAAAPRVTLASVPGQPPGVFLVRDNGVGFPMTQADFLFQPFVRLHDREDFEGTGIGLATVQRILHRHGGRIWVESAPGQGATFYFELLPGH
jgi:PAS domain S-box-containing protein